MTVALQEVVDVDAVDCVLEQKPWAFAANEAAAIEAHWADALLAKPRMFNGRVLLQHRGSIEREPDGRRVFRGAYLETDFKAFLAWRDFGFPSAGVRNGFGMAALSSSDGAFILGEMSAHTANAGIVYFASGTPDPQDVRVGRVDIEGSVRRELEEEMGLAPPHVSFDPGFTLVMDAVRVGFMKRVRSPEPADALLARIEAFLETERDPELAGLHVVRSVAEIGPSVQLSAATYLRAKLDR